MRRSRSATLDAETLCRKAKDRFLDDPEFQRIAAERWIEEVTPEVMRQAFHHGRSPKDIPLGLSEEELQERVEAKLATWYESIGDRQAKKLLKMRRPELLYTIDRRRGQVEGELRIIAFEEELASGLPDDETPVEDAFDERERFALWIKHFGREE